MTRLNGAAAEKDFLARVVEESGQNLTACIQCGKCSGGCPIASAEVGGPRRLIARIQYGQKRQALEDPTWWYCVACGTCMTRCPVEINMYRVATALCEIAEREGVAPSEPDIHLFEELFVKSVERHGRANELRVVAAFNLRTRHPFKDLGSGLTLMRKGAISPGEMLKGSRTDERTTRLFARLQRKGTEDGR
ncbi:MAG TPA: 4Fe-4S dicluster domain-containing protein [Anaeromyxobacteraceae bacterium]|nr:4Fe-4S dicluster domain-containing protein [Anaeromyxobacteraceae bacterium]